jgi:DNA-binding Lrp family transcriptional regulator
MATRFITVSIEIMHDKNLTANQKFILAEIEQLSQLDNGCIASNQHFSELTGIARESVSRSIKDLEVKGYINTEIINGSRNHLRKISLNKTSNPPKQNIKPPLTKHQETKENKTINKTINSYDLFLSELKEKVSIKSKVTKTKEGKELFSKVEDKELLIKAYVNHQLEKKEFAQRITAFMMDYKQPIKEKTIGGYTF